MEKGVFQLIVSFTALAIVLVPAAERSHAKIDRLKKGLKEKDHHRLP